MIVSQSDRAVPPQQFAEKIGYAGKRIPPAEHDNALAQHRGFLHRTPPQSGPDAGMMLDDLGDLISFNPGEPSWHHGGHRMVRDTQQECVQIVKVAWD